MSKSVEYWKRRRKLDKKNLRVLIGDIPSAKKMRHVKKGGPFVNDPPKYSGTKDHPGLGLLEMCGDHGGHDEQPASLCPGCLDHDDQPEQPTINNQGNLDLTGHMPLFDSFFPYSKKTLGYTKQPGLNFISDEENAQKPLGKTAQYDPYSSEITIYTDGRHIKDVLRSIAHELVHHAQNERGEFEREFDASPGYALKDDHLWGLEQEAYKDGNSCFRRWEDTYKQENQLEERKMITIKKKDLVKMLLNEDYEQSLAKTRKAVADRRAASGETYVDDPTDLKNLKKWTGFCSKGPGFKSCCGEPDKPHSGCKPAYDTLIRVFKTANNKEQVDQMWAKYSAITDSMPRRSREDLRGMYSTIKGTLRSSEYTETPTAATACKPGEQAIGVNPDGTPKCKPAAAPDAPQPSTDQPAAAPATEKPPRRRRRRGKWAKNIPHETAAAAQKALVALLGAPLRESRQKLNEALTCRQITGSRKCIDGKIGRTTVKSLQKVPGCKSALKNVLARQGDGSDMLKCIQDCARNPRCKAQAQTGRQASTVAGPPEPTISASPAEPVAAGALGLRGGKKALGAKCYGREKKHLNTLEFACGEGMVCLTSDNKPAQAGIIYSSGRCKPAGTMKESKPSPLEPARIKHFDDRNEKLFERMIKDATKG